MKHILQKAYGINLKQVAITPIERGLIHNTWLVDSGEQAYIFQRINAIVFKDPPAIAQNVREIGSYLAAKNPDYLLPVPIVGINGKDLQATDDGYFRLFPFIKGSHTVEVVENTNQAYEAARQFGKFSALLDGFDVNKLRPTIPDFHNLSYRYNQFELSIRNGDPDRIREGIAEVTELRINRDLVDQFHFILADPGVPLRVVHHDTKISNVLFDERGRGLCVIDLDTVMPGYFMSDFGDMARTYISPVSEEEGNLEKIIVRESFFRAIAQGYFEEMGPFLSEAEWSLVFYAGQFMIYMQALRFLTDYFRNDSYYGAKYEKQNLVRARNQLTMLERFNEKRPMLLDIIEQERKRFMN